jgi:hypothetical protein
MSWDRCTMGHPGLMTLESESTTVPVAALVFHEYFFRLDLACVPSVHIPMSVSVLDFTHTSYSDGPSLIEGPHF